MNLNVDQAIAVGDVGLFSKIHSQTSLEDKKSLLAIQDYAHTFYGSYVYLEIGSYLGGSLQPHVADQKCMRIYSIDKRPILCADNRFEKGHAFQADTKAQMMANLSSITPDLSKLRIYDMDASQLPVAQINPKPNVCFIDGEHTDKAVLSDFKICQNVLADNADIVINEIGAYEDVDHEWVEIWNKGLTGADINYIYQSQRKRP